MSGITNPAEEYFKDGLWSWATSAWEKLISSGGRLFTALHGWDGSAWRKLPMVWGYSDRWTQWLGTQMTADGHLDTSTTVVPAGYVYVLELVFAKNQNRDPVRVIFQVKNGTNFYTLKNVTTPGVDVPATYSDRVTLKQGDQVRIIVYGCINLDNVDCGVWGYKMKIAE